jgi:hypothetical protein
MTAAAMGCLVGAAWTAWLTAPPLFFAFPFQATPGGPTSSFLY